VDVPRKIVASIMAFGAGVLIATLSFDLVGEAVTEAGIWPTVWGFATGAVVYVAANYALDAVNARNRRGAATDPGTGTGIAIGALLDGVPESMVLGVSMVAGNGVSIPVLVAVLISNIPEGLSSTAELKSSGRSAKFVFVLWGSIALASALSSLAFGLEAGQKRSPMRPLSHPRLQKSPEGCVLQELLPRTSHRALV
jgi:ZIP family zinc transporter